jgi:hypothetical protein
MLLAVPASKSRRRVVAALHEDDSLHATPDLGGTTIPAEVLQSWGRTPRRINLINHFLDSRVSSNQLVRHLFRCR